MSWMSEDYGTNDDGFVSDPYEARRQDIDYQLRDLGYQTDGRGYVVGSGSYREKSSGSGSSCSRNTSSNKEIISMPEKYPVSRKKGYLIYVSMASNTQSLYSLVLKKKDFDDFYEYFLKLLEKRKEHAKEWNSHSGNATTGWGGSPKNKEEFIKHLKSVAIKVKKKDVISKSEKGFHFQLNGKDLKIPEFDIYTFGYITK